MKSWSLDLDCSLTRYETTEETPNVQVGVDHVKIEAWHGQWHVNFRRSQYMDDRLWCVHLDHKTFPVKPYFSIAIVEGMHKAR